MEFAVAATFLDVQLNDFASLTSSANRLAIGKEFGCFFVQYLVEQKGNHMSKKELLY